ncbi:MAG: Uma2 family endonuclease [Acidobacteriaceae bacterium]|nr:Uma2 family endonuclease [Acidobacteriaceae bacterium]
MATAPNFVSFDEYLNTSYSPDCEYIDGAILERNVGKGRHAFTQLSLGAELRQQARSKGLVATSDHRVRVSAMRIRIPDLCVLEQLEEVVTKPPRLCVEILSPEDRWTRVNAAVADYQEMGVPYVWVIDPYRSRAWIFELDNPPLEVRDGNLTAPALGVEVRLIDILPPENN